MAGTRTDDGDEQMAKAAEAAVENRAGAMLSRRRLLRGGLALGAFGALSSLGLLAACGGDDEDDGSDEEASPGASSTTAGSEAPVTTAAPETALAGDATATAGKSAAPPTPGVVESATVAVVASPTGAAGDATPDGAAFPRTLTDAVGEVTIPARPERIVTLTDFGDLEVVLALGVEPVLFGFTNAWETGEAGGAPWVPAELLEGLAQHDFTAYELDFEAIAMGTPDLIIGMDWAGAEVLEQLNAIAPTLLIAESMPWREVLTVVGAALGRDADAEAQIATIEGLIAETAAEVREYAEMPIMVGSAFGDVLYLQGLETPVGVLLQELGLTFVPGEAPVLTEASLEQVNLLEPAEILLSFATDPEGTAALEASPLFLTLPAVQRGGYYPIPPVESRGLASGVNPFSAAWGLPMLSEIIQTCGAGEGKDLAGA